MEKRLIAAIVLSFLVLMGYQYFFAKRDKAASPVEAPAVEAPPEPVPGTAGAIREQEKTPEPEAEPVQAEPTPQDTAAVAGEAETDVVVDTPLFRAVWSNKGAVLKSWTLKKHKNSLKEGCLLYTSDAADE